MKVFDEIPRVTEPGAATAPRAPARPSAGRAPPPARRSAGRPSPAPGGLREVAQLAQPGHAVAPDEDPVEAAGLLPQVPAPHAQIFRWLIIY